MAATRQDRIVVAIVVARLAGTASRHARGRDLTPAEHDRAVAELMQIAAGRTDLLAEWAGLAAGGHEGSPDEAIHRQAAQLCLDVGADKDPIPRWIAAGRHPQAPAQALRQRVPGKRTD